MRKSIITAASLLFALSLGAAPVWAELPSFEELDRDGNGYISASEANALPCLAENFHRIETESELGLNRREYHQAVGEYCQRGEFE